MNIKWFGHSCFALSGNGVKLLTDPFDPATGYQAAYEKVDAVTVSHGHHDHSAADLVPGQPLVIKGPGQYNVGPVKITGIAAYHDSARGVRRGEITMYLFEMEDLRLLHAGDLGHYLYQDTVDALGRVDVLFLPVGGVYTIDAGVAAQVVRQLNPPLVLPMHYQTPAETSRLGELGDFTKRFPKVERRKELEAKRASLPAETTVMILEY